MISTISFFDGVFPFFKYNFNDSLKILCDNMSFTNSSCLSVIDLLNMPKPVSVRTYFILLLSYFLSTKPKYFAALK